MATMKKQKAATTKTKPATRNKQHATSTKNRELVMQAVPGTVTSMAERTGLSISTISKWIQVLIDEGKVYMECFVDGKGLGAPSKFYQKGRAPEDHIATSMPMRPDNTAQVQAKYHKKVRGDARAQAAEQRRLDAIKEVRIVSSLTVPQSVNWLGRAPKPEPLLELFFNGMWKQPQKVFVKPSTE